MLCLDRVLGIRLNEKRAEGFRQYRKILKGPCVTVCCSACSFRGAKMACAGDARFGAAPNEERSAELEGLRDFLEGVLKSLDSRAQELAAPADRMRKLLTASDKRAALHDMAGANLLPH